MSGGGALLRFCLIGLFFRLQGVKVGNQPARRLCTAGMVMVLLPAPRIRVALCQFFIGLRAFARLPVRDLQR